MVCFSMGRTDDGSFLLEVLVLDIFPLAALVDVVPDGVGDGVEGDFKEEGSGEDGTGEHYHRK